MHARIAALETLVSQYIIGNDRAILTLFWESQKSATSDPNRILIINEILNILKIPTDSSLVELAGVQGDALVPKVKQV